MDCAGSRIGYGGGGVGQGGSAVVGDVGRGGAWAMGTPGLAGP
jgi:hypothetical protein